MVHQVVNNSPSNPPETLDRAFVALSHPVRRRIVERLARGPATVAQASEGISVSKPAISKHVRVLEEAGVISRVIAGREHHLSLPKRPLGEASEWIARQQELWERKFDVLDEYLSEKRRTR
jgi:DNA-binding transcriptional ArsR family regulator